MHQFTGGEEDAAVIAQGRGSSGDILEDAVVHAPEQPLLHALDGIGDILKAAPVLADQMVTQLVEQKARRAREGRKVIV